MDPARSIPLQHHQLLLLQQQQQQQQQHMQQPMQQPMQQQHMQHMQQMQQQQQQQQQALKSWQQLQQHQLQQHQLQQHQLQQHQLQQHQLQQQQARLQMMMLQEGRRGDSMPSGSIPNQAMVPHLLRPPFLSSQATYPDVQAMPQVAASMAAPSIHNSTAGSTLSPYLRNFSSAPPLPNNEFRSPAPSFTSFPHISFPPPQSVSGDRTGHGGLASSRTNNMHEIELLQSSINVIRDFLSATNWDAGRLLSMLDSQNMIVLNALQYLMATVSSVRQSSPLPIPTSVPVLSSSASSPALISSPPVSISAPTSSFSVSSSSKAAPSMSFATSLSLASSNLSSSSSPTETSTLPLSSASAHNHNEADFLNLRSDLEEVKDVNRKLISEPNSSQFSHVTEDSNTLNLKANNGEIRHSIRSNQKNDNHHPVDSNVQQGPLSATVPISRSDIINHHTSNVAVHSLRNPPPTEKKWKGMDGSKDDAAIVEGGNVANNLPAIGFIDESSPQLDENGFISSKIQQNTDQFQSMRSPISIVLDFPPLPQKSELEKFKNSNNSIDLEQYLQASKSVRTFLDQFPDNESIALHRDVVLSGGTAYKFDIFAFVKYCHRMDGFDIPDVAITPSIDFGSEHPILNQRLSPISQSGGNNLSSNRSKSENERNEHFAESKLSATNKQDEKLHKQLHLHNLGSSSIMLERIIVIPQLPVFELIDPPHNAIILPSNGKFVQRVRAKPGTKPGLYSQCVFFILNTGSQFQERFAVVRSLSLVVLRDRDADLTSLNANASPYVLPWVRQIMRSPPSSSIRCTAVLPGVESRRVPKRDDFVLTSLIEDNISEEDESMAPSSIFDQKYNNSSSSSISNSSNSNSGKGSTHSPSNNSESGYRNSTMDKSAIKNKSINFFESFLQPSSSSIQMQMAKRIDPQTAVPALSPETYVKFFATLLVRELTVLTSEIRLFDLFSVYLKFQQKVPEGHSIYWLEVPFLSETTVGISYGDKVLIRELSAPYSEFEALVLDVQRLKKRIILISNLTSYQVPVNVRFTVQKLRFHAMWNALNDTKENTLDLWGRRNLLFPAPCSEERREAILQTGGKKLAALPLKWIDKDLNEEQKSAVGAVTHLLPGDSPFVIFGPPGTGKTRTLVEAILQIFYRSPENRLLVITPSHASADVVLLRLANHVKPNVMFRLISFNRGINEVPLPVQSYTYLDTQGQYFDLPPEPILRQKRIIVSTCIDTHVLYDSHDNKFHLPGSEGLNYLFIDEAAQATEPETLVALRAVRSDAIVVLTGDHRQLGPIVRSERASRDGLSISWMERLMDLRREAVVAPPLTLLSSASLSSSGSLSSSSASSSSSPSSSMHTSSLITKFPSPPISSSPSPSTSRPPSSLSLATNHQVGSSTYGYTMEKPVVPYIMLVRNYRSHPEMLRIPDELFYGSSLMACAEKGNSHVFVGWDALPNPSIPIWILGVQGKELREPESTSLFNTIEAEHVRDIVKLILKSGKAKTTEIAVIAPFRDQVKKIRLLLRAVNLGGIDVGAVEDYQGQERSVIVLSTVRMDLSSARADAARGMGIFHCPKRANVALTRAKSLLVVVGSPAIMVCDEIWMRYMRLAVFNHCYSGVPLGSIDELTDLRQEYEQYQRRQQQSVTKAGPNASNQQEGNGDIFDVGDQEHDADVTPDQHQQHHSSLKFSASSRLVENVNETKLNQKAQTEDGCDSIHLDLESVVSFAGI